MYWYPANRSTCRISQKLFMSRIPRNASAKKLRKTLQSSSTVVDSSLGWMDELIRLLYVFPSPSPPDVSLYFLVETPLQPNTSRCGTTSYGAACSRCWATSTTSGRFSFTASIRGSSPPQMIRQAKQTFAFVVVSSGSRRRGCIDAINTAPLSRCCNAVKERIFFRHLNTEDKFLGQIMVPESTC